MFKETFILRTEWYDAISKLSESDQSMLLKLLFEYHLGNLNNLTENLNNQPLNLVLVWKLIVPTLERNVNYYDKRRETSKLNGGKGGRPREKPNKPKKITQKPNETLSDSDSDIIKIIYAVVEKLNMVCGTSFNPKTKTTGEKIKARLKDGYTQADMEKVIENRQKEWGADKKMSKYLRPETLFSPKFEGYLVEAKKSYATQKEIVVVDVNEFFGTK